MDSVKSRIARFLLVLAGLAGVGWCWLVLAGVGWFWLLLVYIYSLDTSIRVQEFCTTYLEVYYLDLDCDNCATVD